MEKLVYVLWDDGASPSGELRERLLGKQAARLLELSQGELVVHVADVEPGPGQVVRSQAPWPPLAALVSLWLHTLDARAPVEQALRRVVPELAGYLVTESLPRDYAGRDWPDGERSPGVQLVSLFEKPEHLSDEAFLERWHGSHTPLSLRIHPLTRYVRNAVVRPLTPNAPSFRGIVPEGFETLDHFLDPGKLFGSQENLKLMVADMQAFLDVARVHWTATSEYILRS